MKKLWQMCFGDLTNVKEINQEIAWDTKATGCPGKATAV